MKIKRVWGMVATMHLVWGMLAYAVYVNWNTDSMLGIYVLFSYLGYWLGVISILGAVDAAIEFGEV